MQPVQAIVASRQLDVVDEIADVRIRNARRLDQGLRDLKEYVKIPERPSGYREVYQLYQVGVARRDELVSYLETQGIEAKVHYPIPLHLQQAAAPLGYERGDFPVCERQADEIITLPAHQHIAIEQIDYVIAAIHSFYGGQ